MNQQCLVLFDCNSIWFSSELNLIEAYDLLMEFVAKHTSDKFHLINNVNTSVRDLIAREVIGNILVHRDYSSAYPAKVIIEKNWLKTENWCIPRKHGNIMQDEFQPYPKNPIIQRFFANTGRTDTIGYSVINLYKYTPFFSDGGKPELFEDDVFKITIPLNKEAAKEASDQKKLSDREQAIYNLICENKHLTVEQVMAEFDILRATVFRDYAILSRGLANMRARDFYDVYEITHKKSFERETLKTAFLATCEKRDTMFMSEQMQTVLEDIGSDMEMRERWNQFKKNNYYVEDLSFDEVMDSVQNLVVSFL